MTTKDNDQELERLRQALQAAQLCDVVFKAVADEREQAFRLGWEMRK